jgi:DNA-binding MarR family transcriptional regulator
MSRTLETKKKILGLLKNKDMTITGLSSALGLSTATVSQHIEDLSRAGTIEKVENVHFRKLKYYRIKGAERKAISNYVTYLLAVVLVSAATLAFYLHGAGPTVPGTSPINGGAVPANSTISGIVPGQYGGALNKTLAPALPQNLSSVLNTSRAYGFNFSQEMFRSNSSSQCMLVRISACDNNVPSQFTCLNSNYYAVYVGQEQAAFLGQAHICPQFILSGTASCSSLGGYCEVAFNQSEVATP